jgi:hypothetical protein
MKKIAVILVAISLVSVVLSACSTKAEPIYLPEQSEIETVQITNAEQIFDETDLDWIAELIEQASLAKPTNKATVQDVPNVSEYIRIDLILSNGTTSTLFVYQEKNEWYIEQPYQGIYLTGNAFIDMLTAFQLSSE